MSVIDDPAVRDDVKRILDTPVTDVEYHRGVPYDVECRGDADMDGILDRIRDAVRESNGGIVQTLRFNQFTRPVVELDAAYQQDEYPYRHEYDPMDIADLTWVSWHVERSLSRRAEYNFGGAHARRRSRARDLGMYGDAEWSDTRHQSTNLNGTYLLSDDDPRELMVDERGRWV